MPAEKFGHKRLRIFFWCVAIALGALDAWATRNTMNPDGVSYLDMGDAYWRGDWDMAVNAYWSPLYSWLLGLALKVLRPSAYWEYPVVHLVNFVVYVGALATFEFLMRAFIDYLRRSGNGASADGDVTLPEWAWWTLGYTLFIWTSLKMITIKVVAPDMCVAAFVYLACALLLRMRSGTATRRTFVLFGVVLGFGYLAKAVMFPLAFVFLAVALFSLGSARKAEKPVMISALVFLAITSPFAAALSHSKGRLTFGDSGKVVYAIYHNDVDLLFPETGSPKHPERKVFEMPAAYEFGNPVGGTYPPWYDPTYWHEGIAPHFDLKEEVRPFTTALVLYGWIFLNVFMELNVTVGLLVLYFLAPRPSRCVKYAAANWPLLIPTVAAFGMYAVVYTEFRYVAEFVVLLWLAAFSGVRLSASPGSQRLITGVIIAIAATSGISAAGYTLRDLTNAKYSVPLYWQAASSLAAKGVRPSDKMALIWNDQLGKAAAAMEGAFVARLAKVRIIAEVPRARAFWASTPATQSQVIQALSATGAQAVLTFGEPPDSTRDVSWERLGTTNYYLCRLHQRSR